MTSSKPTIGFAGLGAMGGGMAQHLVKSGFPVVGYDIAQPLLDRFVAAGGRAASTPRDAASHAQFFISMVATEEQNTQLLFEGGDDVAAVHGLARDATLIICSTVRPDFLPALRQRLDTEFHRSDVRLLDCPVSGGTLRAADGTLSLFAAGAEADVAATVDAGVLAGLGANLYRTPGGLGAGSATKCAHQLLAATNIVAASEAMGLAASAGLHTPSVATHVTDSSAGASFMFANRVPHMLADDWRPESALAIILKDAGIVTASARTRNFPTPLAATAEQMCLAGAHAGYLRDDDAGLVRVYLPAGQKSLVAERAREADPKMVESRRVSAGTVAALLAGIHLAASMEAMAFSVGLGLDRGRMCEIIRKAAGWSRIFEECVPSMLERDAWSLADCPRAAEIGQALGDAVERCRAIDYPCPMATMALDQFAFAGLRDRNISGLDRKGRSH